MSERSEGPQTGKIVVVSGPSGSGKTTVCDRLRSDPHITLSISATTRNKRPGEQDGVQYHFVGRDEFLHRVRDGRFAEYAEYNGNLYGTPRQPLQKALEEGRTVLVEIDVQGAAQLRKLYPEGMFIFLDVPNRETAATRLERRNTEAPENRYRRLETAERERGTASTMHFDHQVINDDLDETVAKIRHLIAGGETAG